jgi:hypothetical protein
MLFYVVARCEGILLLRLPRNQMSKEEDKKEDCGVEVGKMVNIERNQ